MIFYKTTMKDIPANCNECALARPVWGVAECPLPWKNCGQEMRKPCTRKRPKECPLVAIRKDDEQ